MSKVEKKARYFLDNFTAEYDDEDLYNLMKLIKEQDRDTRHACAELFATYGGEYVTATEAHDMCMNCQAV